MVVSVLTSERATEKAVRTGLLLKEGDRLVPAISSVILSVSKPEKLTRRENRHVCTVLEINHLVFATDYFQY